MLRSSHGAAILAVLMLAGCSTSRTYQIAADPNVPEEVAAAVKDRTFHEGRNPLVDFDTHKLYGVITDGALESLTLEIKDWNCTPKFGQV